MPALAAWNVGDSRGAQALKELSRISRTSKIKGIKDLQ